jgi:RNA polymerase sigma-70 factor (ECF subfamily)
LLTRRRCCQADRRAGAGDDSVQQRGRADGRQPAEEGRPPREATELKLKGLSPQHRTVLVLRDIEGLSYEEIAAVTEMPLGSVKARLHRARGAFVDRVGEGITVSVVRGTITTPGDSPR